MKKYNNSEESLKSHISRDQRDDPFYLFFLRFLFHLALFFSEFQLREKQSSRTRADFLRDEIQSVPSLLTTKWLFAFPPSLHFLIPFLSPLLTLLRSRTDSFIIRTGKRKYHAGSHSLTHSLIHSLSHIYFLFRFRALLSFARSSNRLEKSENKKKRREEKKTKCSSFSIFLTFHTHSLRNLHNVVLIDTIPNTCLCQCIRCMCIIYLYLYIYIHSSLYLPVFIAAAS